MKTLLTIIVVFILIPYGYAQIGTAGVGGIGYGPEIGIGTSYMHFQPDQLYTSASSSFIYSGKIGGVVDISLNNKFYLQTGLAISRKGNTRTFAYTQSDSFNEAITQTLTIGYIDLPFNVIYKTGIQGIGRFFMGIGVVPSYIFAGNNKLHAAGVYNGSKYDTSMLTRITPGKPINGFDIGVNLTAGYELSTGLFFKAYYTAGINDIGLGGEVDKNRVWGIATGYIFGKGRNINKETDDLIDKSP